MVIATSSEQGGSRSARWLRRRGLVQRALRLPPDAWEKIDKACERDGLSLSAWVDRMADRHLAERLPDAPFARHIPHDYRAGQALDELLAHSIETLAVSAEVNKRQVAQVQRQMPGDWKAISAARSKADLAWNAVAWMESIRDDQALRNHVYRPVEQGGKEIRHRSHASSRQPPPPQDPAAS